MSLACGLPSGHTYIFSDISDTVITLTNPNSPFAVWDQPGSVEEPKLAVGGGPVLFRVYSKSLIQASQVFKTALTGPWTESSTGDISNGDRGYNINAEGWDSQALSIILNAIHSRTNAIPKEITLEMLCKIAVLVDYYKLHDALDFFASVWIEPLRNSRPTCYGRDLILWICVSSVFRIPTVLVAITKIAIEESPEELRTLGLPIPDKISEKINRGREKLFKQLINLLDKTKQDLLEDKTGCSFECRSMLLGALTKQMHDGGYSSLGAAASSSVSVSDTITKVRKIHSPDKDWHKPPRSLDYACKTSLPGLLDDPLKGIADSIRGVGLEDQLEDQLDAIWSVLSPKKKHKKKGSKRVLIS